MKVILLILGTILVAVAIAIAAGAVLWRRGSAELVRRLETGGLHNIEDVAELFMSSSDGTESASCRRIGNIIEGRLSRPLRFRIL